VYTQHTLRSDISQREHNSQRPGLRFEVVERSLGYFEHVGQYTLAMDMLRDSARMIAKAPNGPEAAAELEWLRGQDSPLRADTCFEIVADLLRVDDVDALADAFVRAMIERPGVMYDALNNVMHALEAGNLAAPQGAGEQDVAQIRQRLNQAVEQTSALRAFGDARPRSDDVLDGVEAAARARPRQAG
jgi:hypothetical protein